MVGRVRRASHDPQLSIVNMPSATPKDRGFRGPIAVGGLGGSGTRVVAHVLAESGMNIGPHLNPLDNLFFSNLLKNPRWHADASDAEIRDRLALFGRCTGGLPAERRDLWDYARAAKSNRTPVIGTPGLRRLALSRLRSPRGKPWGWKEPNTHIYLSHLPEVFPEIRYVHVIRNPLEMAHSDNRQQLTNWGDLYGVALPETGAGWPRAQLEFLARGQCARHGPGTATPRREVSPAALRRALRQPSARDRGAARVRRAPGRPGGCGTAGGWGADSSIGRPPAGPRSRWDDGGATRPGGAAGLSPEGHGPARRTDLWRSAVSKPLDRVAASWRELRELFGEKASHAVALVVASVIAGFSEAIILATVASAAAAMVSNAGSLQLDLGPFNLHVGIEAALGVTLAVAALRLALQLVIAWLPAEISAAVQASLRQELLAAYTRASWPVRSEDREGVLQELMTSQVIQIVQVASQVLMAISGSAMFLSLMVAALLLSPLAAVVILAAAIGLFLLLRPLARRGRLAGRDMSQANVMHASGVGESVRLTEETEVFGASAATRERVGDLITDARNATFHAQLLTGIVRSVYQSLVILLVVAGLFALNLTGGGAYASLGAVVLMLVRASTYGQQFQVGYQGLNQLLPYIERIKGAIARYSASTPLTGRARCRR